LRVHDAISGTERTVSGEQLRYAAEVTVVDRDRVTRHELVQLAAIFETAQACFDGKGWFAHGMHPPRGFTGPGVKS